ncbi:MAG: adenine methylase [Thermoanaerobacteraceae bacterium]|nr:adenine methylase [Thermoanaerobacteraceae bacterium]
MAKPFVKWAGGKSQLLSTIRSYYPEELGDTVYKYCEPFVGGGAVLFDILTRYNLKEVYINDLNNDLINAYIVIKYNVNELIDILKMYEHKYLSLEYDERKKYYYYVRDIFNELKTSHENEKDADIKKAALFIFLNRTCYNGLYRVNRDGLFNVPAGEYKHPTICDESNLLTVSKLLKNVIINCEDYKTCADFVDNHTLVYFDPPYRPISSTSSFTAYHEEDFTDKHQKELADFYRFLDTKGAKLILSNSDPKNTNPHDDFFDILYKGYYIYRVKAKRAINSKGNGRGNINELLITNYLPAEERVAGSCVVF